ncbi:MAG: MlaD family protein [Myxococcota bacterium]
MPEDDSHDELPEAVAQPARRISAIWMVPLVAALIAGLLLWRAFQDRGPMVTLTFSTASGIDAGKTTLRYLDVVVGMVETVRVSDDLSHVVIGARLHRDSEAFRAKGTRFWVERPRFGPEGVSGLGTLVSGAFIGVDPGPEGGKNVESFVGLDQPPLKLRAEKGLSVSVHTLEFGAGLNFGAPVLYEGVKVGRVTGLSIEPDQKDVIAQIFIEERYAQFVRKNTRFWNASGLHFDASLGGVHVNMDSLESVLMGGIAFSTPGMAGPRAEDGTRFSLYRNARTAQRDFRESLGLHVVLEASRLGFLRPGDAVLYRGERVGRVLGHDLQEDSRKVGLHLQIDPRYAALVRTDSVFWNASGVQAELGLSGFHLHVASIESLLEGSVSLATPDPPGPKAPPGTVFKLHKQVKERWLSWAPRIDLGRDTASAGPAAGRDGAARAPGVESAKRESADGFEPATRVRNDREEVPDRPAVPSKKHLFDGAHHGLK